MAIYIGYSEKDKLRTISEYAKSAGVEKIVHLRGMGNLQIDGADLIEYDQTIMYSVFYRLLQEINNTTLIIIDECLLTQERNNLTYNCIRHYLNLTDHQLIFNYLPQIDTAEDFMTLFDFDTKTMWKNRNFDIELILKESKVECVTRVPVFEFTKLPLNKVYEERYELTKIKLFAELGSKDPHTIPRNLYLIGAGDKLSYLKTQKPEHLYASRSSTLGGKVVTYRALETNTPYNIMEFQHRFLDMCKFFFDTRSTFCNVLVSELRVDIWYMDRYVDWRNRLEKTCSSLQQP